MWQRHASSLAGGLALGALLLAGSAGIGADPKPKPTKGKDESAPANPLQGLQAEFARHSTTTPVDAKDLPKEIAEAARKKAPDATIKQAKKRAIGATLKYVALDKPRVRWYQVVVVKDDKRVRIQFAPDGKKLSSRPVTDAKAGKPVEAPKEIEIPAKASKAVKAIKDLYPDAVVKQITTEVYQDPTGIVDVLTYEIEFITKGTEREMVASPDGIIPHLTLSIAEKDLPKAVSESLAKEIPGGKVERATQFEVRAGLQFVALDKPRVLYELAMEKDGKASTLKLRADGSEVPAPLRLGKPRAYLGLGFDKNTTTVNQVSKGGPAEQAGLKPGDKVLALADTKVSSVADLIKKLQEVKPGTEVKLQFQRGEQTLTVNVKLGTPP